MIVVISDVHLGYERCNKEAFESFVDDYLVENEKSIEYLVLLGDILDFWRRSNENVLIENMEILCKLSNIKAKKYYVIGNHDYSLCNLEKCKNLQFEFRKDLCLKSKDKKFRFIHGHQNDEAYSLFYEHILCPILCTSGDVIGKFLSGGWDMIQKVRTGLSSEIGEKASKKLSDKELERIIEFIQKTPEDRGGMSPLYKKELLKAKGILRDAKLTTQYQIALKSDEILVSGHTHRPLLEKNKEANTGSWVSDAEKTNTYLIIEDGKMDLNQWEF